MSSQDSSDPIHEAALRMAAEHPELRITSAGPDDERDADASVAVSIATPGLIELTVATADGQHVSVLLTPDEARNVGADCFDLADDAEAAR